jgi:hypothetical protein
MSVEGFKMHVELNTTVVGEFPDAICSECVALYPASNGLADNSGFELDDSTCATESRPISSPKTLPSPVPPLQILPPGPFRSLGGYLDYSEWPARARFLELDRALERAVKALERAIAKDGITVSEARAPRNRSRLSCLETNRAGWP